MNRHLVIKTPCFCVVKLRNSLAITRIPRLEPEHFNRQSVRPRFSQRHPSTSRTYFTYDFLTASLPFYSILVPMAGVEPAQLSPHAPQACVSTNFTTSAGINKNYAVTKKSVQLFARRWRYIVCSRYRFFDGCRISCRHSQRWRGHFYCRRG